MPDASAPIPSYQLPGVVRPAPLINAPEPEGQGAAAPTPGPGADLRWSYADAMTAGHTLGPEDFTEAYNRAGPRQPVAPQHFPSQQETIDAALSALNQNSLPVTPEAVEQAHSNLLHRWAETGTPPSAAVQDAQTRDLVTRAPTPPAHFQELQQTIQHLETGGLDDPDSAVSPAGAIGRNQIEPGTAREYGFDPDRLHEPDYNNTVRDTILNDLIRRYHGDTQAVLIAYNAGPGVAERWLAASRDNAVLPDETQKYLTKGSKNLGLTVAQGEVPPVWGAPEVETTEVPKPLTWISDALTRAVEATGSDFGTLLSDVRDFINKGSAPPSEEEKKEVIKDAALNVLFNQPGGSPAGGAAAVSAHDLTVAGIGTISALATGGLRAMFPALGNAANDAAREAAQAAIVRETGLARRWQAAAGALFEEARKLTAKGLQETQEWLDTKPGTATNIWANAPDNIKLIDHIENASPYAGGSRLHPQSPLRPVANSIRQLYQTFRDRIEQSGIDTTGFIEDYFPHFWQQPGRAASALGARIGSGLNLLQRHIPTFIEGIQAGLTPKYLDPIEATLRYITGMSNFLAHHDVLQQGIADGYVKYAVNGRGIPAGWVALQGRSSTKWSPGGILRAYAPSGWATPFNRWVDPGLNKFPRGGAVYRWIQQASNMTTAMRLGVSGYHAWNISTQSIAAHFALAIGNLAHLELVQGLKNMGLGLSMAGSPIAHYARGRTLTRAYLHETGTALDKDLMEIYAEAGGRVVGRGLEYGYQQANNLFEAWRRGSLSFELKNEARGIIGKPGETLPQRAAMLAPRLIGAVLHETNRVMSSLTAPLFDRVIPAIKTAAWADEMEAWLRQNAGAARDDVILQARRLQRSMDDRFGEMVQDNLFWPRILKQTLNMATVSIGYEYGTLRAFGGAAKDLLNGDVLSTRARWLLAYPLTIGLVSSIYQYLHTGLAGPSAATPGRDLVVPRTGGSTRYGQPERALLPSDEKDALQVFNLFNSSPNYTMLPSEAIEMASSRLNPLFSWGLHNIITGTKWNGDPIYSQVPDAATGLPVPGWKQAADSIFENFGLPISIANARKQAANAATKIGTLESFLGVRPAPEWLQDPEHVQAAQRRAAQWEIRREERERARGIRP